MEDRIYHSIVNGHSLVELSSEHIGTVYVCADCQIRGPYPSAFEDIKTCSD